MRQIAKCTICCLLLFIVTNSAWAIILYSGDNSANLSAPDTARTDIFNSVAKITRADGTGIVGSAVHIKDKYLLTAEHVLYKNVTPRRSHITFDGNEYWAIDLKFLPIQIGTADLVLFKLIEDPNLSDTSLYSQRKESDHTKDPNPKGTIIGWGQGRAAIQTNELETGRIWDWEDTKNTTKRWGTNEVESTGYSFDLAGKAYYYFITRLDSDYDILENGTIRWDDNEAAFTLYDSGAGLFVYNSGTWQLAGITTLVTTDLSSTFGSSSADYNYFVRISQYRQTILDNLPDTSSYAGWAIDQSLYGANAETTADPDQDGLDNENEFTLGTNPNNADTSNDGLNDKDLFDYGLDPNVNHLLLYNAIVQSIGDLRAGTNLIEVIDNQATITLNLESSDDLESWAMTGDSATIGVTTSENIQFYRFKLSQ